VDYSTDPPIPPGTVIEGIGHDISSLQFQIILRAGVTFRPSFHHVRSSKV